MSAQQAYNVPNVPADSMFELADDKTIVLTSIGRTFFEQMIKFFFLNFSNEGLVAPTQNSTNIPIIQNNKNIQNQYTCAYGTLVYNVSTNNLMVCLNNGSNIPQFLNIITSAVPTGDAFLLLG